MVLIPLNCTALNRDLMGCGGNLLYTITVSWTSLVSPSVNNLPAVWETWVRSQGWEDPLEEGMAALTSILASLLPQLVKNPSAIQETPVWFLGWEDLLEKDRLPTPVFSGFPCGSAGKESAWNIGDLDSIPGLGRSPGKGKGYPHQYSGPENSMDYIQGVTESQTQLSNLHFHNLLTLVWSSHYGIDQRYISEVQWSWCLIHQVYVALYLHLYPYPYPSQHSGSRK